MHLQEAVARILFIVLHNRHVHRTRWTASKNIASLVVAKVFILTPTASLVNRTQYCRKILIIMVFRGIFAEIQSNGATSSLCEESLRKMFQKVDIGVIHIIILLKLASYAMALEKTRF